MPEQLAEKNAVYLLYHPPMNIARTGHAGLLVLRLHDGPVTLQDVICFFSFYHNVKPSDVRATIGTPQMLDSCSSYTVASYADELIMRGQSWKRLSNREKEDIAVGDLLQSLPTDPISRESCFEAGKYKFAIRLPDAIDSKSVIAELERIKNSANWAAFGNISRYFCFDWTAYNCCSAIDSALQKGMRKSPDISKTEEMMMLAKMVLWMMYFSIISFSPEIKLFSDNPLTVVCFLPALVRVLESIHNAHRYINDLLKMSKGEPSFTLWLSVNAVCYLTALLGAPFSADANSDLFMNPVRLARKAEEQYGATVFASSDVALPQLR